MYYSKRPSLTVCALAGGVCTIGLLGILARAMHIFTSHHLPPTINAVVFALGVGCTIGGGVWIALLFIASLRHQVRALTADIERLRAERVCADSIIAAVIAADQQGEVNSVKLTKVQEMVRDLWLANADQQTQPIATLRSINGKSGA